jgi:DNA-binding NtrC family response regulator
MIKQLDVVVAAASLENRKPLLRVLEDLSLNTISCSSFEQISEVLSRQDVLVVFCEESLGDGSYRDLLCAPEVREHDARIVVTIRTGDWGEYLDAMRLGAFDAIRCPLQPTDIELVVLRALREQRQQYEYKMTA